VSDGDRNHQTLIRAIMVIMFVTLGLPSGLCSLYFTPLLLPTLITAFQDGFGFFALAAAAWFGGLALTAFLGWALMRTWRTGR
jgi:hypothetical protein